MRALINKIIQVVLAILLMVSDQYASLQIEHHDNIYRAGIADGTWPLWIGMLLAFLLAMYAKVVLADE